MPISVTCPSCQAPYLLADQLAGKKVKCQKCQGAIDVPLASAAPPTNLVDAAVTATKPKSVKPKKKAAEDASPFALPSKQGSDTKAKKGGCSCLMIAIFLFLGFGLLGCGGVAAVAFWFHSGGFKDGPDLIAVADEKAADKKKTDKGDAEKDKTKKKDDAKNNPVIEPKKDDAKKDPPADPKKDDANKDKTPVEPKKDKVNPPSPGITAITLGPDGVGRVEGMLSDDDPPNAFGRTHKAYQVQMEAGKNYQIDLVSNDFDSYLFLLDAKNNKITEDENAGGPRNARIIHQAKTADLFRIDVSHFDKKSGKFTLTVRRTEPGVVVKNPDPPANTADISARVIAFREDAVLVGGLVWARRQIVLRRRSKRVADSRQHCHRRNPEKARFCHALRPSGDVRGGLTAGDARRQAGLGCRS